MSTHVMKIHRGIECLLSSGRSQPEMTMSVSFWKRQNYGDSKKKKKLSGCQRLRRIGEMTKQYREDF